MSPELHERAVEIFETTIGIEYSDHAETTLEWHDAVAKAEDTASSPAATVTITFRTGIPTVLQERIRAFAADLRTIPGIDLGRRVLDPHLRQLRVHPRAGLLWRLLVGQRRPRPLLRLRPHAGHPAERSGVMRGSTKTTGLLAIAAGVLALAATFSGALIDSAHHTPDPTASEVAQAPSTASSAPGTVPPAARPQSTAYADALALAAALPLTDADPAHPVPPYSRPKFGKAWTDIDHNGCRQRDDMLARDLVDVVKDKDGCTVLSGVLEQDPYTGKRIVFQHNRVAEPGSKGSAGVQGEHIVSLKAAWEGGAWAWSDQRRLEFANNLADIIAVDGSANESKGEDGPARWIPNTYYRCTFVTKYTQIAHTWEITVPKADRDALVAALTECATSTSQGGESHE